MSKQTADSLFMFSPFAAKYAELYQELLRGVGSYQQLGGRFVQLAEQAHAFRQFDKVRELAQILSNIPIKHYRAIGHYYLAVATNSMGNGDQDKARRLFELVVDTAPDSYKAKAILSLAAIATHAGDRQSQLRYLLESARGNYDLSTKVRGLLGISIYKSMEGYHGHALKDLENLYQLARLSPPIVFFDYLNSLSVELGEAGRNQEAQNIMRHVVASPFAPAYPEWQDTLSEVSQKLYKSRSSVTVPTPQKQPEVAKPESDPSEAKAKPADVIVFPQLKEAPPPEKPERVTPQELREMTPDEKRELILAALRSETIMPGEYNRLMFMFGLIESDSATNILDLEDDAVLDDLMVEWANLVEPEQLAAVLSTLRDCEDDRRRSDLIDRMIRKAFESSQTCGITELEWRLKVECRLPEK